MAHKVLIVDDDAAVLASLEKALSGIVNVISAASGPEAIAKASSENPHLILLDTGMPGMDGYTVCKQLKSNARTKKIPLLFMNGEHKDAKGLKLEIMGLELGALGNVIKPIQPRIVAARVKSLLEHFSPPSAQAATAPKPIPTPAPPPPLVAPIPGRSRMIIEDDDEHVMSWEKGGTLTGFFKATALVALLLIVAFGAYKLYLQNFQQTMEEPAITKTPPLPVQEPQPEQTPQESQPVQEFPSQQKPVEAPQPAPTIPKATCGQIPSVTWWGVVQPEYIRRYVNNKHAGNWTEYLKKWEGRLQVMTDTLSRNAAILSRDGTLLEGDALQEHIKKLEKRLDVTRCLAKESTSSQ